ncbi:MAG: ATP-binding cassette domain-containing protein [Pseudonocardia sp.]|nr:ATP-binding cassette domain-containing protein [Pseudonocardia sp.]
MSATLHATGLSAGHGARTLFSELDLVVAPGDVIGLVGANGAGKSTLLRLLAGEQPPDEGTITLAPPDATVGHLPQEPDRRQGETLAAFLARRTGVADALTAMDATAQSLADGAPGADDAYASALDRWLALGGADLDERAAQLLADLGLGVSPEAAMAGLSGGQAARAGLAALLLSRYDLLLLDEPTNDLDLDGLARLEEFVGGLARGGSRATPAVVVSHDREFLARTVNRIVELDLAQQQVGIYDGGYEAYLAEREVARRHAREAYEEYSDTLGGLKQRAVMQRNWMAQGVRNVRRKAGSEPDKNIRAMRKETSEKQASKARQTEKAIERLDVVEEPRKEWELQMTIASAPRSGAVAARADAALVRRGEFTLGPVTAQVDWADRVVITGANGSGKSTLLGALLGRLPTESGSAGLGAGVRVGEIDQARGAFLGPETLLRSFGNEVPDWPESEVRTLLAKFALTREQVLRPAASLSPGERTRAALALLQAREVNLLVLDEPTNHLDLPAIEQLEQALESFAGTVLLVTHDRRMLDTVRATRRWNVESGGLTER